jgi:transposase InsO family protein
MQASCGLLPAAIIATDQVSGPPGHAPDEHRSIERFHRTLADRWAFARYYPSETARRKALPGWLHHYNHHRPHTAIGNVPPITRLTNLSGQYT